MLRQNTPIDETTWTVKEISSGVETLMSKLFSDSYWENDCFSLIFQANMHRWQVDNVKNYCTFCVVLTTHC